MVFSIELVLRGLSLSCGCHNLVPSQENHSFVWTVASLDETSYHVLYIHIPLGLTKMPVLRASDAVGYVSGSPDDSLWTVGLCCPCCAPPTLRRFGLFPATLCALCLALCLLRCFFVCFAALLLCTDLLFVQFHPARNQEDCWSPHHSGFLGGFFLKRDYPKGLQSFYFLCVLVACPGCFNSMEDDAQCSLETALYCISCRPFTNRLMWPHMYITLYYALQYMI